MLNQLMVVLVIRTNEYCF